MKLLTGKRTQELSNNQVVSRVREERRIITQEKIRSNSFLSEDSPHLQNTPSKDVCQKQRQTADCGESLEQAGSLPRLDILVNSGLD